MVMSTKIKYHKRLNKRLIHVTDWFSTILGLAQAPIPEKNAEHQIESIDFSNILLGKETTVKRENFIIFVRHTLEAGEVHMQVINFVVLM